jgi:hypothetical protein
MQLPASTTNSVCNPILNSSQAIVTAAIAGLPASPAYMSLGAIEVNSATSGSLLNSVPGVNGNAAARAENWIPTNLLQLQSLVLAQAASVYRI